MKLVTKIVIHSIIVLFMGEIIVEINYSPFWGPPQRPLGLPFENHCLSHSTSIIILIYVRWGCVV